MEERFLNEDSPRKSKKGEFDVSWNIILSSEYRNRLFFISRNEKVIDAILLRCKWMLYHRDGKNSEEIYAINLENGEEIARITDQNHDFGIKRTELFENKINKADQKGIKVLLLHNHPRGMPPSITDINLLCNNKNVIGITVGHNGSIYFYSKPKQKIEKKYFYIALQRFSGYSEITRMEKVIEALSYMYGFVFYIL